MEKIGVQIMRNLSVAKNIALKAKLILQKKGKFNFNYRSYNGNYNGKYQKTVDKGKAIQDTQPLSDKVKG